MKQLSRFSQFVGNTTMVWILVFAVLAFFLPSMFSWIAPYINILLGIIMFGMGLTLSVSDFKNILKQPGKVIILAAAQYVVMPLVAVLLVFLFNLPKEIAIGVILVGSSPGGTSSNVMTFLAKGNMALSVAATTVTTILAPIVTPALTLLLASTWLDVSMSDMMMSILQVVLIPVVLGILVSYFFSKQVEEVTEVLPLVSVTGIIGVMTAVVATNTDNIIQSGILIMLVVMLHNTTGYVAGFFLGKLFKLNLQDRKTMSIEVGMQNSGLASALAVQYFEPIAALPGALFSVWHNFSGAIAANIFRKMSPKENPVNETSQSVNEEANI